MSSAPSGPRSGSGTVRAKLACDRCRKKKARCPGEQPICSLCRRLGQSCAYRSQTDNFREYRVTKSADSRTGGRLRRLDTKVDPLLNDTSDHHSTTPSGFSPTQNASPSVDLEDLVQHRMDQHESLSEGEPRRAFTLSGTVRPPPEVLNPVLDFYFRRCENQPLPLLVRTDSWVDYPDEVVCGILSVVARYSSNPYFKREGSDPQSYNQLSRHAVFKTLETCTMSLQTVQAICLLTLADYLDGFTQRANLTLGIGIRAAYSMGLLKPRPLDGISEAEGVSRCCWCLFALERLFLVGSGASAPLLDENDLPGYPASPAFPPHVDSSTGPDTETPVDLGIIAYCLQITAIWGQVMKHATRNKAGGASQLPWASGSEYSHITSRILHFEAVSPNHHRWQIVRFQHRDADELEANRAYWGPWLLMQFLYHSCLALLNHPVFFLGGTPTAFSQIPPSFAQSVSSQAHTHSRWIAHFADLLIQRKFAVTDPLLAYCSTIAATIHAFYGEAQNQEVSRRAKKDFSLCLHLVKGVSTEMPVVQHLVHKLEGLQKSGNSSDGPALSSGVLAEIVGSILEYTNISNRFTEDFHTGQSNPPPEAAADVHETDEVGSSQQASTTDILAGHLGILPPFSCPDLGRISFDEWSFGNL